MQNKSINEITLFRYLLISTTEICLRAFFHGSLKLAMIRIQTENMQ